MTTPTPAPSESLRVFTLGRFVAQRDGKDVPGSAWGRDKSLQLFQFLLTQRRRLMERERIVELELTPWGASPIRARLPGR